MHLLSLYLFNFLDFISPDRRVSLKEDISNTFSEKMSEESRTILLSLSLLERDDESKPVEESISNEECEEMSQSGKAIIDVLTTKKHNLGQLSSIFHQFQAKYFLDISESIEIEFQDETEIILKTISTYFNAILQDMFNRIFILSIQGIFCWIMLCLFIKFQTK